MVGVEEHSFGQKVLRKYMASFVSFPHCSWTESSDCLSCLPLVNNEAAPLVNCQTLLTAPIINSDYIST